MRLTLIELCLFVALFFGIVNVFQSGAERMKLRRDYERLASLAVDLPVKDISKVHIRAAPTGQPLNFAWRIFLPKNYRFNVRDQNSSMSAGWQSDETEFTARIRFREEGERLHLYTRFQGGSSHSTLPPGLAKLLHNRWDQVRVEQIGTDGVKILDRDESIVLLRLKLSDEMQKDLDKLSEYERKQYSPVLFEMVLTPGG